MIEISMIGYHYIEVPEFVIDRPNGSGNYLFLLFHTAVDLLIDGQLNHYPDGTCILYSPNYPQYYKNAQSGFTNDWFHFDSQVCEPFLAQLGLPMNTPLGIHETRLISQYIKHIEQEFLMEDSHHSAMIDVLFQEMLIALSRSIQRSTSAHKSTEALFRQARSIILSQPEKDWTIDTMAELTDLSRSRFSYIYRSIFDVSPKEDLLNARMTKAKYLLQTSDNYTIGEVADKTGYSNLYHFSKQFKKSCGLSPTAFRKAFGLSHTE